jgi:membrane-anchored protein YejM (alkaline phosphatase superfamily)
MLEFEVEGGVYDMLSREPYPQICEYAGEVIAFTRKQSCNAHTQMTHLVPSGDQT